MTKPRLALTTTRERSEELAEIVLARGGEPVILPCIEVEPAEAPVLERVRSRATNAEWLLVTSPRAIAVLWPDGGMPDVPVAAVGQSTATAVKAAGGVVAEVGKSGFADLLKDWPAGGDAETVLFPHSSLSDLSALEALGDRVRVDATPVYTTIPIAPADDPVEAALFGSPSAVAGWIRSRSLGDLVIAAMGPTTAASLSGRGHRPDLVPSRPDFELLVNEVVHHLRDRSPV